MPHHTDTSMLLVDLEAPAAAGVTDLPDAPEQAWTWDRFADVARRVRDSRGGAPAFAINWQEAGAYRWLNGVDQTGGRLLTGDLTAGVAPDEPGLRSALAFTRSFFRDRHRTARDLLLRAGLRRPRPGLLFEFPLLAWAGNPLAIAVVAVALSTVLSLLARVRAWPLTALRDPDLYPLPVGLAFLQGQYATDYPTLMSGALLSALPVLLLFALAQRWFVAGPARTGLR